MVLSDDGRKMIYQQRTPATQTSVTIDVLKMQFWKVDDCLSLEVVRNLGICRVAGDKFVLSILDKHSLNEAREGRW